MGRIRIGGQPKKPVTKAGANVPTQDYVVVKAPGNGGYLHGAKRPLGQVFAASPRAMTHLLLQQVVAPAPAGAVVGQILTATSTPPLPAVEIIVHTPRAPAKTAAPAAAAAAAPVAPAAPATPASSGT